MSTHQNLIFCAFEITLQNEAQAGDGFGSNGHKYVDRLSYFEGLP